MIFTSLTVVAIISVVMGLTVFMGNTRLALNRIYALFSFSIALWMLSNAFALEANPANLTIDARNIISQSITLFATLSAFLFLLFVEVFNGLTKKLRKLNIILLVTSFLVCCFMFTSAYSIVDGDTLSPGDYYIFFVANIALFMASTAYALYFSKSIPSAKKGTHFYSQLLNLRIGYVLAVVPAFFFGGIIASFSSSDIAALSPIFLIFFLIFAGISIAKHRLFDIRLIAVRSAGYFLTFAAIAFLSFESLLALNYLIERRNIPETYQAGLLVLVSLLLAISFTPFKKFFDRVTAKLFYRDAYDTQELLNEFNKAIVSTIDADQLLPRAGVVIEKYLKPEWIAFAIRDSEQDQVRVVAEGTKKIFTKDVENLRPFVKEGTEKTIVTDLIESNNELKEMLQNADIGILSRVTTDTAVEGNGYIIMGYKKSGNMYNSQDLGALEILSNELAIAIQNALQFEEIQKFNITLQDKVDDATKELKKSNEKLKQMDETKDEFISMASHQLRTPLTSVKGYLSMVLEGDAGELNDMQKKMLGQAFISSQRMVYLIADLLNVSRLRTGKFIIEKVEANLAEVVQSEVEQLDETAESRGLNLVYKKPKDFPILLLDETKTRQVIMNFIDNAIYYTPKGGKIVVDVINKDKSIEFLVMDNGLGVPKAEQHNLFTKFYRANNAKKARPDGTGLGLFMAKKVIVAQGGAIIFSSEENKGSTFGFSFSKDKLKPTEITPRQ
jgi:signal transduction histidine kinase